MLTAYCCCRDCDNLVEGIPMEIISSCEFSWGKKYYQCKSTGVKLSLDMVNETQSFCNNFFAAKEDYFDLSE